MTVETGIVVGASVSHSHASIDQIETAADGSQQTAVEELLSKEGVSEAFVLQTCNRAEAYVVANDSETGTAALAGYLAGVDDDAIRMLSHDQSLKHLMAVACGLESLVIGEDQILGQVRDAYEDARGVGGVGPTLNDAVLKALHVGERARTETAINEGAVSLGSAAVRFAAERHGVTGSTALVVGAGEMATLAAKALDDPASRVIVANRTRERAERLAEELSTTTSVVGVDSVDEAADAADVVVSATGSEDYVIDTADLGGVGETCVLDIAQPRDVAPGADGIDGVAVYDLDTIESVTDEARTKRREAAETVETMIDEEFEHLMTQYKRKRADQVIAAMYEGAERIKARELRTAVSKFEAEREDGLSEREHEIVESMADALVGQLLSAPTQSLRDAAEEDDWATINAALQLFGPGLEPEPTELPTVPDGPEGVPEELRERMSSGMLEQFSTNDD